jgi:hypothetical protein
LNGGIRVFAGWQLWYPLGDLCHGFTRAIVVGMNYRDLTIRVLGDFSNEQYANLAYQVGLELEAAGLGKRAILLTDGKISGTEMDVAYAVRQPRSRL